MSERVTVEQRFREWVRAALQLRTDVSAETLDGEYGCWLDMVGSALDHDSDKCVCVVCQLHRRSDGSHLSQRSVMYDRHDFLEEYVSE
jgi:hypothetical protein